MTQVRQEIYDDNGLVEVRFIDVDEPTVEELIADKQQQLLKIYGEIQNLQTQQTGSGSNSD